MQIEKNEYDLQAEKFLHDTGTTLEKKFLKYDVYFAGDKDKRNIREITMQNKHHKYTFTYGDSVKNSDCKENLPQHIQRYKVALSNAGIYDKESYLESKCRLRLVDELELFKFFRTWTRPTPSDYDILACLDPLHDSNFEDFCDSFGYDADSITAKGIYEKCLEQDSNLRKLFDRAELEQLQEIC